MVKITFVEPDGTTRDVDAPVGTSAMEAGRNNGVVGIVAECGGVFSCATCHVYVARDWVGLVGEAAGDEAEMLDFAEGVDATRSRLSCQIKLRDDFDGLVLEVQAN